MSDVDKDVLPMTEEQKTKSKKKKKKEVPKFQVELVPFVKQTSRNASLTHYGPNTGIGYNLERGVFVRVDPRDLEYFEKKTKKGPWVVEMREVTKMENAHFFMFKGTSEKSEGIDLPMHTYNHASKWDVKKDRDRIYHFPNGEWVRIFPEDVERLSAKAMQNPNVYGYKAERVGVKA